MIQINHFTMRVREALAMARDEAMSEENNTIKIRHLLIGLAQLPIAESTAAHVLNGFGLNVDTLRKSKEYDGEVPSHDKTRFKVLENIMESSATIAQKRKDSTLASAHLLAGALEDPATVHFLESIGIKCEELSRALNSLEIWTNEM